MKRAERYQRYSDTRDTVEAQARYQAYSDTNLHHNRYEKDHRSESREVALT
jgi:hypothetical protein